MYDPGEGGPYKGKHKPGEQLRKETNAASGPDWKFGHGPLSQLGKAVGRGVKRLVTGHKPTAPKKESGGIL